MIYNDDGTSFTRVDVIETAVLPPPKTLYLGTDGENIFFEGGIRMKWVDLVRINTEVVHASACRLELTVRAEDRPNVNRVYTCSKGF